MSLYPQECTQTYKQYWFTMQLNKPHLYEENPTSFVTRLPFINTEDYGFWLLQMSHVEGLDCVEEVVFAIPGSKAEVIASDRFSKTSVSNIEGAYNKLLGFNFFGFAWIELVRGRVLVPDDNEIAVIVKFVQQCSSPNNPMSIPFATVDELFSEFEECKNFSVVCDEIRSAFLKQGHSIEDYERMLTAITNKESEFFPTQDELFKFYAEQQV